MFNLGLIWVGFFLIYFGPSQIGINFEPLVAVVIGLGLRSAAYQAQIFRAALNSIPEGQSIAARSMGMSKIQSIRYILLPQVLRISIPGWSNEFTIVLKDTSIAFSIGVIELMRQGRYIYVLHPEMILPILLLIALIYFVLVISINKGLSVLEKNTVVYEIKQGPYAPLKPENFAPWTPAPGSSKEEIKEFNTGLLEYL